MSLPFGSEGCRSILDVIDYPVLKYINVRTIGRKKQIVYFAIFIIVLASGLFVIPFPAMNRLPRALLDMVHFPSFALLGFFVCRLWVESKSKTWLRRIISFILLVAVSYGTEVLQRFVGRTASPQDLLADIFGAAAGIIWSWRRGIASRFTKRFLEISCILLICGGIWFPIFILVDVVNQRREFPVLSSWESPLEQSRWLFQSSTFQRSSKFVTHGKWSMMLTMNPARYPSATLDFPLRDWTSYSYLAFDIYNPGEPNHLILKISDQQHTSDVNDRYHARLLLPNGWSHFKFPLSQIADAPRNRKMEMSQIDKVQFFMVRPTKQAVFYLDHLRLE